MSGDKMYSGGQAMKKNGLIVVFFLIFAWGCTLHPELTRRYKDAQWGPTGEDYVTVSAFTLDAPPADKPKNLLMQLSPQGQASLVKEIGERTQGKPAKEFLDQLAAPADHQGSDVVWDKTAFKKRIVFAVEKKPGLRGDKPIVGLADRINELVVTLKMCEVSDAEFASWDRFDTHYDTVDLGKVSRTQSSTAELGMTIGPGQPGPATVNPKISETRSLQEETPLKPRYIVLSGRIDRDKQQAMLREEGVAGIDLAGTFSVDFDIRAKHAQTEHSRVAVIGPLSVEGKGDPVEPGAVKISFSWVKYKKTADPIRCRLSYDYTLRHVVGEERELVEGLQSVSYLRGSSPAAASPNDFIHLVDYRELLATVYTIAVGRVHGGQGKRLALMEDDQKILYFPSYDSAKNFLKWIKAKQTLTVAKYKLGVAEIEYVADENGKPAEPSPLGIQDINKLIVHAEVLNPEKTDTEKSQCR
jgi:hypothetical protein